jgi:hypothetical protein
MSNALAYCGALSQCHFEGLGQSLLFTRLNKGKGAKAFRKMTTSIMTVSKMTLNIMTLSLMTYTK